VERTPELDQKFSILGRETESPRELEQQATEAAGCEERTESLLEPGRFRWIERALAGEPPPQYCRELEAGVSGNLRQPEACDLGAQGPAERAFNLNNVEGAREILERMSATGLPGGIDDSFPAGVFPP
jgi:hypothetical protein